MGVRVQTGSEDLFYPDAHDWFATVEGDLQVYQHLAEAECTVAEIARGFWRRVWFDPMPDVSQEAKEETIEEGSK